MLRQLLGVCPESHTQTVHAHVEVDQKVSFTWGEQHTHTVAPTAEGQNVASVGLGRFPL